MSSTIRKNAFPHRFRKLAILLLALSLIFTAQPAWAAETATAAPELDAESAKAFLDGFFASDLAKSLYTGAAVVIVKDGETIAKEGYGYASKEDERAVDPDNTVFRLASVSKTFTAVAVMQLVEQGKVALDEDIRTYLPGLEFDNPYGKPVTVADLLTHRSGFAPSEPTAADMVTDLSIQVSMEDYARERMPALVREPGSAYMYDNYAYLLLGLIVQNAGGQPYEQYMDEHVFAPLGMEMSGFALGGALLENLATAYDPAGQPMAPYMYLPTIMPHGGMLATADDVAKFMVAFLNEGKTADGRILSEASVKMMQEYRSAIHPLLPDTTYGFESATQIPMSGTSSKVIAKYGDLPGNSSMLLFIPEEEVGIFLTYNQAGALRDLFFRQFAAAFFPAYAAPIAPGDFTPATAEQLGRYEGLYADLRLSTIVSRVSRAEQNGQPFLTIHDAFLGTRPLQQVGEHLFVDGLTQTLVAFRVDENGQATHLREGTLNPLGYAGKTAAPAGFADVPATDPYAPYIYAWQSLGLYPNDAAQSFGPDEPVTRAELARDLLVISGLTAAGPREQYAFTDIQTHELAPFVQLAAEMGMVLGDGKGNFYPDRLATRQEAAVMVWNIYRYMYPAELFSRTTISGDFAPWAAEAIRMAVTFGLHGPEVAFDADGAADFKGTSVLTRREAAAYYHQLMFQPIQQMAAQLMQQLQQLQQAPADQAEPVEAAEAVAG